jgi:glucan endo-1,3-beta-D-glucosidase
MPISEHAMLTTLQQGGTANTPISAIPAAVGTNTGLLLGLWASGGQGFIDNEIAALTSAITTYGPAFAKLVTGISVGSEDLYRISPTGIAAKSGPGADPSVIADYIGQVRKAIAGTALGAVPVGHVDTWTAWVNGSNSPVIDASDFIGMDAYPYFQNTMANSIDSGSQLFFDAFDATQAAVNGKPVWVTETGWPVSGPTENLAIPSIANAKTYWDEVGCKLFGTTNTWWYTVQDAEPTTPSPSFGLVAASSTSPLYDLTCPAPGSVP